MDHATERDERQRRRRKVYNAAYRRRQKVQVVLAGEAPTTKRKVQLTLQSECVGAFEQFAQSAGQSRAQSIATLAWQQLQGLHQLMPEDRQRLDELDSQLRKAGNNLNQAVHAMHRRPDRPETLEHLQACLNYLYELLTQTQQVLMDLKHPS